MADFLRIDVKHLGPLRIRGRSGRERIAYEAIQTPVAIRGIDPAALVRLADSARDTTAYRALTNIVARGSIGAVPVERREEAVRDVEAAAVIVLSQSPVWRAQREATSIRDLLKPCVRRKARRHQ
jgi:hypothetical protein